MDNTEPQSDLKADAEKLLTDVEQIVGNFFKADSADSAAPEAAGTQPEAAPETAPEATPDVGGNLPEPPKG